MVVYQSEPGADSAAYLNYILFDVNYNLLDMLARRSHLTILDSITKLSGEGGGWQPAPDVTFTKQKLPFNTINVKQEGYLFAYLSYDNDSNNCLPAIALAKAGVYFDDLKVTHTPTNVLQYNEYYPFGLQTSNSWTRETSSNDYLYNAGNELNGNSGWYETFFRGYDPVLGRFMQADPLAYASSSHTPYSYAFNDPVFYNDPMGDYPREVAIRMGINRRGGGCYACGAGDGFSDGGMFGGSGESKPWYRVNYGSWIPAGGGSTMSAGSFINSALNSSYGGSWSNDGSYSFYNSDAEAFGAGVGYLDATNGWGGTEGGSVGAARQSFYGIHDKYVFRWGSKGGFKTVKYLGLNEGYAQQGPRFFTNEGDAYKYMWNGSFDAEGNVQQEVAAFLTSNGVLVLPTEGQRTNGQYAKNGPRISYNDFLPLSRSNGNLFVTFDDTRHQVLGQVHTHPNTQPFGPYEVAPDLGTQNVLGVPVYLIRTNGFYNLDGTVLGTQEQFFNGTKSLIGKK